MVLAIRLVRALIVEDEKTLAQFERLGVRAGVWPYVGSFAGTAIRWAAGGTGLPSATVIDMLSRGAPPPTAELVRAYADDDLAELARFERVGIPREIWPYVASMATGGMALAADAIGESASALLDRLTVNIPHREQP
jgi:hypothetical protein